MARRKVKEVLNDIRNAISSDVHTLAPGAHSVDVLEDILETLQDGSGGGGVVAGALVAADNGADGIKLSIRNEVE